MYLKYKNILQLNTLKLSQLHYKHTNSYDYQYLQKCKIPTMHFQPSLPRLPIPKLELTCERYLAAQRPLLIDEAFRKTETNVNRFKETNGKKLQALLQAHDKVNKHTSYISEPWFDMYLRDRKALPINYNPMLVFNNDPKQNYNDQLIRTANLLISSLRFYKSLNAGVLKPDVYHLNPKKSDNQKFYNICSKIPSLFSWYAAYLMKAYPLDMSQYANLFNSTRIPETDKDRLFKGGNAKHIVIQHNGNFYVFDVFDQNGCILPADEILAKLKYLLNNAEPQNKYPVGVLTTLNRDKWATIRHNLAEMGNGNTLKMIDCALFNICLDGDDVQNDPSAMTRKFLFSDGTNRWFDKSFSLMLSKDGVAAVNFEHSWGDGVAVSRYFQDIFEDSIENPQVHPDTPPLNEDQSDKVRRLDFKLDDNTKLAIDETRQQYTQKCSSLDVNWTIFDGLGKDVCKKHNISPDAVMQLGFQAAFHKKTGRFVPTYESCSTAAFKHGRTETIRPSTMATKTYCLAINSLQKPSFSELKNLVLNCSRKHGELTKEAAMGQGFDRHLYVLRLFSEKHNMPCNIFQDPDYASINHNIISTSTLSTSAVFAGGFGPVVDDGFGIAYVIRNDSLGVLATNYKAHRNGKDFMECVVESFKEIRDILEKSKH